MEVTYRTTCRTQVTRLINTANELIQDENDNVNNLTILLTRIKVANENLRNANVSVRSSIAADQFQKESDSILDYEDKAAEAIATIELYLQEKQDRPTTQAESTPQRNIQVEPEARSVHSDPIKLPRLELKKFNGDLNDWIPFWQQFRTTIHDNINMDDVTKFNYLQTLLVGKAATTIVGLTPSAECYKDAIALLKDEYGNTDRIVDNYIQQLLSLQEIKNRNDTVSLRSLYNKASIISRSLTALGVPPSQYSMMIRSIVLKSIPWSMRKDFHRQENNVNNDNGNDSLAEVNSLASDAENQVKQLIDFIKREVDSMEKAITSGLDSKSNDKRIKPKDSPKSNLCTAAGLLTSNASEPCLFCNAKTHSTISCDGSHNLEKRKSILKEHSRCFRCTRPNHSSRDCKNMNLKCNKCKGRHATVMCDPNYKKKVNDIRNKQETRLDQSKPSTSKDIGSTTGLLANIRMPDVYLQTARGIISMHANMSGLCVRLVLDGGSQLTFIKESISRQLDLPVVGTQRISVITFGVSNKTPAKQCNLVSLNLKSQYTGETVTIRAVEVPEICLDTLKIPKIKDPKLHELKLADIDVGNIQFTEGISLLVGADNYWTIVTGETKRLSENLTAINTMLGWTLHGRNLNDDCNVGLTIATSLYAVFTDNENDDTMSKFWDLELIGISGETKSSHHSYTTDFLENGIHYKNGRYEARLPWKEGSFSLDDNYTGSVSRLKTLTTRLIKNDMLERYDLAIRDYLNSDVAEEVPPAEMSTSNRVYYMPHRPVIREDKSTTKLRVVYDASAHPPECSSLNELLETGQNLIPDLLKILLNFRTGTIALTADIEKAFLQISLSTEDRDTHRFLWYKETPTCAKDIDNIQVYRMKRITFGVTSSPFILAATIKKHLNVNRAEYTDTVDILLNSFYMDDLVTSVNDLNAATRLFEEASLIMSGAGMTLRKWDSNNSELRQKFEPNSFEKTGMNQKILGLCWCSQTDVLYTELDAVIQFATELNIGTKRTVLQTIARIFDPLGFLMPFTITLRILLQTIWKLKLSWDEPLPNDSLKIWTSWCKDLSKLRFFTISRPLCSQISTMCQLHIFADASPAAYGIVAYLRNSNEQENIDITFICSKARIAPLKQQESALLTLPRLELTAALMAARFQKYLLENLSINFDRICLWSDSKITLFWLKGNPNRWKPYVANRVSEIRKLTNEGQWSYCAGTCNPADLLTRGISAKKLLENDTWLNGPEWLNKPETSWQNYDTDQNVDYEIVNMFSIVTEHTENVNVNPLFPPDKTSNFDKLLRITGYVLRFIHNIRHPNGKLTGMISAKELDMAEEYWIKYVQATEFLSEIKCLRKKTKLNNDSKILMLTPILDTQDVLRLGGRLEESDLAYEIKHPIILPKRSFITDLLVRNAHSKLHHAGIGTVLTHLRQKYWILSGRQIIKSTLSSCVICKRLRGKAASEPFAPLPKQRLEACKPFEICGIDFAGPLYIKNEENYRSKSYIMLITCAAVRAVHLELVPDLTTDSCLLALRRFISRRGVPKTIYSDNAKTFKRAALELKQLGDFMESDNLKSFIQTQRIDWRFIVERAAWWGGFWERLIGTVKSALKSVLGRNSYNFLELQTILTEVEATVNARPLTYIGNDPTELEPLTPSHFYWDHIVMPYLYQVKEMLVTFSNNGKNANEFYKNSGDDGLTNMFFNYVLYITANIDHRQTSNRMTSYCFTTPTPTECCGN